MILVVATALMPLFFMLLLTPTLVSASHSPRPHEMAITLAGPAALTAQVRDAVQQQTGDSFAFTTTTDAAAAAQQVADRDAVGALVLGEGSVTVVEASAGGVGAAGVVRQLGSQVAAELGAATTVQDVAPLATGDATGTVLFFLFTACTVGGFLSVVGPSQVRSPLGAREMLITNGVAAVAIPLLAYAVLSPFVGGFGVSTGTLLAVLGIAALYTLTIGLLATFAHQLVGVGGVFLVMIIAVAFNLPSSGGTAPVSMLPSFWQMVHQVWVGAGGYEAMRSTLYFAGAGTGHFLVQLLVWTVVLLALVLTTALHRRHKRQVDRHERLERDLEGAAGFTNA
ncbi:hypothetical protein [Quadrisphaera sp. KR29]|uniref:hypothetical protein n=1 Tax=Quadrisphaera sp. KR29 TaxID=3461391 RepID=UPI004043B446